MPPRLKTWFAVLVCIALAVSTGLNIFLFQRSWQDYLDLNRTRLDPLGLTIYPATTEPAQAPTAGAPTVVFFGDSRAQDWPPPANAGTWNFINRGIAAQTTAQVLGRFDQHVAPLQPQIIILEVGINDLKTVPLFPDQKQAILQRCQQNIDEIVRKSRNLGATVILATIFPTGRVPLQRQPFWSDDIRVAVGSVNTHLASLQARDVMLFDATPLLADSAGQLRLDHSKDELHLNAAGYAALNEALRPVLLKLAH